MDPAERRVYRRYFFPKNAGIKGVCTAQKDRSVSVSILNISIGGLGLSIKKQAEMKLQKGDRLKLVSVEGNDTLTFLKEINMEVKWIVEHEQFENIGFGCEFLNIAKKDQDKILKLINTWP